MFILTQMHGLGLSVRARIILAAGYVLALLAAYGSPELIQKIHEILRIPMLDFAVVAVLYVLWLAGVRTVSLWNTSPR